MATVRHRASPSGIVQEVQRRRWQLGGQGQGRQRTPVSIVRSGAIDSYEAGELTSAGLPTSFRANHKKGFSKL